MLTLMEVEKQAMLLPQEQQLQLAHDILGKQLQDFDPAWLEEVERRVADIDNGKVELINGKKAFAALRSNLKAQR